MTPAPKNPRPGWYPDPEDLTRQRRWDGNAWTGETRETPSGSAPPAPSRRDRAPELPAPQARGVSSFPPPTELAPEPHVARPGRSGLIALTLGIVAFLTGWAPFLGAAFGIAAIVVALVARRQRQRKVLWVTGLVLASVATITSVIMAVSFMTFLAAHPIDESAGEAATENSQPSPEVPSPNSESKPDKDEPETEEIREYWPISGDLRMPQFVGMNLADALDEAKHLRLTLRYEDERNDRNVFMPTNWTVVSQDIAPATDSREGDRVEVRVLKHDEVTDEVTEALAYDLHLGERSFTGTITGYERDMTLDVSTVLVDAAPVSLDLISPLAPLCGSPLKDGLTAAAAELEKQLPIGQRVLVVMSRAGESHGFIHVLGPNDETGTAPPADSVNERLIRTGWWVPDASQMEGGVGVEGWGSEVVAFTPYAPRYPAESQAVVYVPFIAQAGDQAVANYVGTIGDCRRAAEADANAYVARWQEAEREREKAIAEMEERIRSGFYLCRDGDGDGVCYEH